LALSPGGPSFHLIPENKLYTANYWIFIFGQLIRKGQELVIHELLRKSFETNHKAKGKKANRR